MPAETVRYGLLHHPAARLVLGFAAMCLAIWLAQQGGAAMRPPGPRTWHTPAFAVPVHLATVLPALPLGLWILLRPKGDAAHRLAGRIWAMLLVITALDSFFIRNVSGGLSPIHIFSVVTLLSVPRGIWHARQGRIDLHRRAMIGPYVGLLAAGVFAIVPGRLLGDLLFG